MLHQNDAQSMHMWRQRNPHDMFYYNETGAFVARELNNQNMPFILGIDSA
jgi:hypothetical protein